MAHPIALVVPAAKPMLRPRDRRIARLFLVLAAILTTCWMVVLGWVGKALVEAAFG
jgi:hypothetical protein